jgi:hypothetical protein
MSEFTSEDDVKTFEGWLKYQGYDSAALAPEDLAPEDLAPEDLARWRELFDEQCNLVSCPIPRSSDTNKNGASRA